jgi:hypothetical protein
MDMEIITFMVDMFFIFYPLILYITLKEQIMKPLKYGVFIGDYVIYDVDLIKMSALYLLYPIALYYLLKLPIIYVIVQSYYAFIVLSISFIGYRRKKYESEYFLMGFLFSAFLSEYWEIPFYLSKGISYNMGVSMQAEILGKITKLVMGVLGLDLMFKIGLNHKRTIFFLIGGIYVLSMIRFNILSGSYGGNSYQMWVFKLISFLILYLNIVFK